MPNDPTKSGYLTEADLKGHPGIPSAERRRKGPVAVIECPEEIPCNPCESSCKVDAIEVGSDIIDLPKLYEDKCIGCLTCVAVCPGQAIFVVDESLPDNRAAVTMPYEYLPLPQKGETVTALDRAGNALGDAVVTAVRQSKKNDQTVVVTIEVPREWSMRARSFKLKA
jgi:Fe-S-cluster-containing hydrogenase component 2